LGKRGKEGKGIQGIYPIDLNGFLEGNNLDTAAKFGKPTAPSICELS
jgi:hypothetical protein